MPVIDKEKCNGCGLCVMVCRCHALTLVGNAIVVSVTEDCGWCLECELVCPTGAISCPFEIVLDNSQT